MAKASELKLIREALEQIASIANKTARSLGNSDQHDTHIRVDFDVPGCSIMSLPKRLLIKAANTAIKINPVNSVTRGPVGAAAGLAVLEPMQIAVMTNKYWGPTPRELSVSFMEQTNPALRRRILEHMNAWSEVACISFRETNQTGEVRISFNELGYWSYLGTDVLLIPANRPTMNLQAFSMSTPESEYKRVVRHETGHTLGFPHEHMRADLVDRIDRDKAYAFFEATQGWNRAMVDAQVLTSLDEQSLLHTPADQTSIMCYQLPGSITKDNQPILGGVDINATDRAFAGQVYPKQETQRASPRASRYQNDWNEDEDVDQSYRLSVLC